MLIVQEFPNKRDRGWEIGTWEGRHWRTYGSYDSRYEAQRAADQHNAPGLAQRVEDLEAAVIDLRATVKRLEDFLQ